MDFSLGGLGWLLGNQLMWNNLVPLGGELHQLRGSPHYGTQRTEEGTILPYGSRLPHHTPPRPLTFTTCQPRDLEKRISHLLPDCAILHPLLLGSRRELPAFWPLAPFICFCPVWRLGSLGSVIAPQAKDKKTHSLLSAVIQMGSSLAEIVQDKNNHTRLN